MYKFLANDPLVLITIYGDFSHYMKRVNNQITAATRIAAQKNQQGRRMIPHATVNTPAHLSTMRMHWMMVRPIKAKSVRKYII